MEAKLQDKIKIIRVLDELELLDYLAEINLNIQDVLTVEHIGRL